MKLERDGKYLCVQNSSNVENWTCMGKIPGESNWLCFCINNGNNKRFFREFTEDGEQIMDVRGGTPRQLLKELPKPKVKKEGYITISDRDSILDYNGMTFRTCSMIVYDKARLADSNFKRLIKVEWEE